MGSTMQNAPQSDATGWLIWLRSHKFKIHLVSLLLLVVAYPISEGAHDVSDVVELFFVFVVVSGTFAIDRTPKRLATALVLALLAALATGVFHAAEWFAPGLNRPVSIAQLVSYVAFLAVAAGLILSDVMRAKDVTGDTIFGAICVYLLLGVSWALWFCVLEVAQPESFAFPQWLIPADSSPTAWHTMSTFIYFSFTTLTTLGYGDVTPISAAARTCTWLEAVTGQLYLAVLVARLVAMRVAASMNP